MQQFLRLKVKFSLLIYGNAHRKQKGLSNIINIVHSRGKRVFISGINQLNEKLLENSNEFNLLKQKGFIFSSVLQVIEFLKTK